MLLEEQLSELQSLLPNKIFTSAEDLTKHCGMLSYVPKVPPEAVCYAESEDDIIKLTDFCIVHKIPLIPYGSGTSTEGHITAIQGGICLDISKMNKVLEFNSADSFVIVQAGISYNKLNEFLDSHGFHFPVEAGWGASIGGMAATNASGAGATDSGSMTRNVLAASLIVCKEGVATKIKVGAKSPKTSSGYNLLNLFIGSEGTLGIFTELVIKVRKNFLHYASLCCQFEDIQQAVKFVVSLKGRVQFRRVELLDKLQTEACVLYSNIEFLHKDKNTLLIELFGNDSTVQEEIKVISQYLQENSVLNICFFNSKKSSEKIWMMRKDAAHATINFVDKNKSVMVTDASVPLSKLAECLDVCYQHMRNLDIVAPVVAHVGDGNFHFGIVIDPNDKIELQNAKKFSSLVVEEALKVGGTCSGEHGIGLGKISYLINEHGDNIFFMQAIKKIFDPYGIFNPGKVLPSLDLGLHQQDNHLIEEYVRV